MFLKNEKKSILNVNSFEIKYPSVQADRGCWSGTAQNILAVDHNATAIKNHTAYGGAKCVLVTGNLI